MPAADRANPLRGQVFELQRRLEVTQELLKTAQSERSSLKAETTRLKTHVKELQRSDRTDPTDVPAEPKELNSLVD